MWIRHPSTRRLCRPKGLHLCRVFMVVQTLKVLCVDLSHSCKGNNNNNVIIIIIILCWHYIILCWHYVILCWHYIILCWLCFCFEQTKMATSTTWCLLGKCLRVVTVGEPLSIFVMERTRLKPYSSCTVVVMVVVVVMVSWL